MTADIPGPEDTQAAANEIAKLTANAHEVFAPLDEAALGHRAQLLAAGWSAPAAEQMACQFHAFQVAMLMKGIADATTGTGTDERPAGTKPSAGARVLSALTSLVIASGLTLVAVWLLQGIAGALGAR